MSVPLGTASRAVSLEVPLLSGASESSQTCRVPKAPGWLRCWVPAHPEHSGPQVRLPHCRGWAVQGPATGGGGGVSTAPISLFSPHFLRAGPGTCGRATGCGLEPLLRVIKLRKEQGAAWQGGDTEQVGVRQVAWGEAGTSQGQQQVGGLGRPWGGQEHVAMV